MDAIINDAYKIVKGASSEKIMLNLAVGHQDKPNNDILALLYICKYDSDVCFRKLFESIKNNLSIRKKQYLFKIMCKYGSLANCMYIHKQVHLANMYGEAFCGACSHGNLVVAKWLKKMCDMPYDEYIMMHAIMGCQLTIIKWLAKIYNLRKNIDDIHSCVRMCYNNCNIDMAIWFYKKYADKMDQKHILKIYKMLPKNDGTVNDKIYLDINKKIKKVTFMQDNMDTASTNKIEQ